MTCLVILYFLWNHFFQEPIYLRWNLCSSACQAFHISDISIWMASLSLEGFNFYFCFPRWQIDCLWRPDSAPINICIYSLSWETTVLVVCTALTFPIWWTPEDFFFFACLVLSPMFQNGFQEAIFHNIPCTLISVSTLLINQHWVNLSS